MLLPDLRGIVCLCLQTREAVQGGEYASTQGTARGPRTRPAIGHYCL